MFPVSNWAQSWAQWVFHHSSSRESGRARDAARLLGLSHQRVHQLTQSEAEER